MEESTRTELTIRYKPYESKTLPCESIRALRHHILDIYESGKFEISAFEIFNSPFETMDRQPPLLMLPTRTLPLHSHYPHSTRKKKYKKITGTPQPYPLAATTPPWTKSKTHQSNSSTPQTKNYEKKSTPYSKLMRKPLQSQN
ncbi:hypothetical protein B9Z19DRAFT_1078263 [Tuber borchii]|uniref:Uncharacterized protein n=1 Tax=Tuber borchii TaxID=42251 RepID=A0A2T6ZZR2_TUBBO|nr:hypothetical protein B9Z19DRAFT_1078263 [Tuber borchii]